METDLDALTDLRSRRTYDREAEELLEVARATGSPFAILVIDVNQFKQINDTRGHTAGDAALCGIATEVTKTAHGRGRGYRYGGDEMVVLMPNASAREAYASAERLANAVQTLSVPKIEWPLSVSIGVAAFPEHGDSLEALFNAADRAMYQAKRTEGAPVQIAPSDTRQGAIGISFVPLASAGPTNEVIWRALQFNAHDRTYAVVGAVIRREDVAQRWRTSEVKLLREAILDAVDSDRVKIVHTATMIQAHSRDAEGDTSLDLRFYADGVGVIVVGWRFAPEPFPIEAGLASFIVALQTLHSDKVLETYGPAGPIETTMGLVNWPAGGITSKFLWGLGTAHPSGTLQGFRSSQTFAVPPRTAPWVVIREFLPHVLGDAGYLDYERYLKQAPPPRALVDLCRQAGLHIRSVTDGLGGDVWASM